VKPTYPLLRDLLLGMAQERTPAGLLTHLTAALAEQADVALARVWLVAPGDECATCPMRADCERHVPCLHLAASAGRPREPGADWSRTDGAHRRFPFGVRKIGRVGQGETIRVEEIAVDASWIARPEWAAEEGIRGFGGTPLVFADEVLGALGVFTRTPFRADVVDWLRIVADHAAAALATARAFEEIERLRRELSLENQYLREEVKEAKGGAELVGRSAAMQTVLQRIALVAPTEATVLIQGESGTGKELVAREIHRQSARADAPLIQVNCAAVPNELYESEFFGHVRGAFTGATRDRAGRFAAANGGTLFLDEVGEIPLALQGKLLRVLQEGTYERVGEERTRRADVRVVAATNRDLRAEVAAGRFREDLYYRLDVFPVSVAPLRERPDDVAPLAQHFVASAARRTGRAAPALTAAELEALSRYAWPGNVRELQNVVERAMITWQGGELQLDPAPGGVLREAAFADAGRPSERPLLTESQLRELERENLLAALQRCRWKVSGAGGAAQLLGVKPNTLVSRIKRFGLERPV